MEAFFSYSALSEFLNSVFEKVIFFGCLVWLAQIVIKYTRKNIIKEGFGKGAYMGLVAALEASLLVFLIYYPFPQFLVYLSQGTIELAIIRWFIIYAIAITWSYYVSHKNSGRRGIWSVLIILTTLFFGWLYDHWLGILAMSVPILSIYLYIIYKVAQVILPASNPEDKQEAWKKMRIFLAYLLGVQHPIWIAESKTGRTFEKPVVEGNAGNEMGKHGIVWTWSHQVAAIAKGAELNRIEGPGLIFTELRESPTTLIDLRMQSRISTVHAVTKDGMDVSTVVFTAFVIDRRNSITLVPSKHKHGNENAFIIDHTEGSFPYSAGRIRSVLSTAGIVHPRLGETEKPDFFWDEWVVKQVEYVTRQVVAERSLDELWHPQHDDLGASALNEIANRLQELLSPQLAEVGVHLITVRIVNYELPEQHKIIEQNLNTWKSYWEQQITETKADIEMIYREEIEKAHAYSKSILLSAIADSINKARKINENLPRHMIAQYFIHALEEYIKGQPGLNVPESKKRLEMVKEILNTRLEGNE